MTGDDDCVYNRDDDGSKRVGGMEFQFWGQSKICVKSSTQGMVRDLGFSLNLNQTLFWFKFNLPTFFSLFCDLCSVACAVTDSVLNCQNHFCFED